MLVYSYAAWRGRSRGTSGRLYTSPWDSHTLSGTAAFLGRALTTVKATLREALPVVAKCLGSLSCCPTGVVINHLHAISGSDSPWHQCEHPPGHDELLCFPPVMHVSMWEAVRVMSGMSLAVSVGKVSCPFRGSFSVISLFQTQALMHKWKWQGEQS